MIGTFKAERLRGLEVDDQAHFGGLHHRQVGRFFALENPPGIDAGLMGRGHNAASVAHQAAGGCELLIGGDGGHRVAGCQRSQLGAVAVEECIDADHQRTCPQLGQARKDRVEIAISARVQDMADLSPSVRAAAGRTRDWVSARAGLVGLTSSATTVAVGTTS